MYADAVITVHQSQHKTKHLLLSISHCLSRLMLLRRSTNFRQRSGPTSTLFLNFVKFSCTQISGSKHHQPGQCLVRRNTIFRVGIHAEMGQVSEEQFQKEISLVNFTRLSCSLKLRLKPVMASSLWRANRFYIQLCCSLSTGKYF